MRVKGKRTVAIDRGGRLLVPNCRLRSNPACNAPASSLFPVVYYAAGKPNAPSCIMLTGSHNLPVSNGFKIVLTNEAMADLQAKYADGFSLAFSSKTVVVVVRHFEGESTPILLRVQQDFKRAVLSSKPDAALPF